MHVPFGRVGGVAEQRQRIALLDAVALDDVERSVLEVRKDQRTKRPCLRLRAIHTLFVAAAMHGAVAAQTPDAVPDDSLAPAPVPDAYLDDTARRLVLGRKAARGAARLAIDAYTAVIRERMGIEMPDYRRSRPWLSGERTARFRWSREEPTIVHVLGASWRDPSLGPDGSEFFPGLRTERFAADPLGDPFRFGLAVFGPALADVGTRSPLEPGSERHYQFRSGDTISVRLAADRVLRAVAVTVIPRYPSIRLVSAIMWIDPESLGLARVAYRLAKPIDREMSWRLRTGGRWRLGLDLDTGAVDSSDSGIEADSALESDSATTRPGIVDRLVNGMINGAMPRLELDISTVIADYGLWEMRHWLPRSVTWKGHVAATEGVTAAGYVPPPIPATIDWTVEIEDIREGGAETVPGMPATAAEALRLWRQDGDSVSGELEGAEPGETVTITPADRRALSTSEHLPATLWEDDRRLDNAALEQIASDLGAIGTGEVGDRADAPSPWTLDPPGTTLRLLRYNPVEHLSLGNPSTARLRMGTGGVDSEVWHPAPGAPGHRPHAAARPSQPQDVRLLLPRAA